MPYASKKQWKFMFAKERAGELPEGTARRWAHHTDRPYSKLPKRVKKSLAVHGLSAFDDVLDRLALNAAMQKKAVNWRQLAGSLMMLFSDQTPGMANGDQGGIDDAPDVQRPAIVRRLDQRPPGQSQGGTRLPAPNPSGAAAAASQTAAPAAPTKVPAPTPGGGPKPPTPGGRPVVPAGGRPAPVLRLPRRVPLVGPKPPVRPGAAGAASAVGQALASGLAKIGEFSSEGGLMPPAAQSPSQAARPVTAAPNAASGINLPAAKPLVPTGPAAATPPLTGGAPPLAEGAPPLTGGVPKMARLLKRADGPPPPQGPPPPPPGSFKPSSLLSTITTPNSPQAAWERGVLGKTVPQAPGPSQSQAIASGQQLQNNVTLQNKAATLAYHLSEDRDSLLLDRLAYAGAVEKMTKLAFGAQGWSQPQPRGWGQQQGWGGGRGMGANPHAGFGGDPRFRQQQQQQPDWDSQLLDLNRRKAMLEAGIKHNPRLTYQYRQQLDGVQLRLSQAEAMQKADQQHFGRQQASADRQMQGRPLAAEPQMQEQRREANPFERSPEEKQRQEAQEQAQRAEEYRRAYQDHTQRYERGQQSQNQLGEYQQGWLDDHKKAYGASFDKAFENNPRLYELSKKNPELGRMAHKLLEKRMSEHKMQGDMNGYGEFNMHQFDRADPEFREMLRQQHAAAYRDPTLGNLYDQQSYKDVTAKLQTDPNDQAALAQKKQFEDNYRQTNPYALSAQQLQQNPRFQEQLNGMHGQEAQKKAREALEHVQTYGQQGAQSWQQYGQAYQQFQKQYDQWNAQQSQQGQQQPVQPAQPQKPQYVNPWQDQAGGAGSSATNSYGQPQQQGQQQQSPPRYVNPWQDQGGGAGGSATNTYGQQPVAPPAQQGGQPQQPAQDQNPIQVLPASQQPQSQQPAQDQNPIQVVPQSQVQQSGNMGPQAQGGGGGQPKPNTGSGTKLP